MVTVPLLPTLRQVGRFAKNSPAARFAKISPAIATLVGSCVAVSIADALCPPVSTLGSWWVHSAKPPVTEQRALIALRGEMQYLRMQGN
jgi:hypothetical protein